MTHTYAVLIVSKSCYDEVHAKLTEAGYDHACHDNVIDMHGIGLQAETLTATLTKEQLLKRIEPLAQEIVQATPSSGGPEARAHHFATLMLSYLMAGLQGDDDQFTNDVMLHVGILAMKEEERMKAKLPEIDRQCILPKTHDEDGTHFGPRSDGRCMCGRYEWPLVKGE